MEEKKEKKCMVCGIPEEEATRVGAVLKSLDEMIGFKASDDGTYVCSMCIKKSANKVIPDMKSLEDGVIKMISFMEYIDSSAALFGLSEENVTQACLNTFIEGVHRLSNTHRGLGIAILKTTKVVFDAEIKILESGGDIPDSFDADKIKKMFRGESQN